MTLELQIEVEVTETINGEFVIQTQLCNGVTPRFTLTIEQAELLVHKLKAALAKTERRSR